MKPICRTTLHALTIALPIAATRLYAQPPEATPPDSMAAPGRFGAVGRFVNDLFDISAANVGDKAMRILVVIALVIIARYFTEGIRLISRFAVYSQWGPLKYIFRDHQRSVTIHRLLTSVVKYVVYLSALGYILQELGVNYTTFLASLSLIGIAVGFGSQGLVQDVVTGFFILFENQFSVGDMVEISGQVGVVEDIGLRTTRLRNYFGADITFQNRNIPLVGRYRRGAVEAIVDVAIADAEKAEAASALLLKIGSEFKRQFDDIIMETPHVHGLLELATGEQFVRIGLKLWPGQQWVVDTQLLPRIREIFEREALEIPSDRVVAFYHTPTEESEGKRLVRAIEEKVRRVAGRGRKPGVESRD